MLTFADYLLVLLKQRNTIEICEATVALLLGL